MPAPHSRNVEASEDPMVASDCAKQGGRMYRGRCFMHVQPPPLTKKLEICSKGIESENSICNIGQVHHVCRPR